MSSSVYDNINNFNMSLERQKKKCSRRFIQQAFHALKKVLSNLRHRKPKPYFTEFTAPTLEEIDNSLNEALESKTTPETRYLIFAPDSDICLKTQYHTSLHQEPQSQYPNFY